jgi:hypothetical protein
VFGRRPFFYGALLTLCTSGLSLSLGAAHGQPRLADELVASPEVWRAFRPLVIATGDGAPARAVSYLRVGTELLRKAEGKLERDAVTLAFQTRALESLEDFDLETFFQQLPRRDGPFRYFAFEGAPTRTAYRFRELSSAAAEVSATSARRDFGDSSSVIRMRHLDSNDDKRYLLQWRGGVGVGPLSWTSLVAGVHDALAMLEVHDAPAAQVLPPLLLRTADAQLKKSQPDLSADDRRVLAAAWASFPQSAALLSSVGRTDDVVDEQVRADGVTRVSWSSRWDAARTRESYPGLTDFFHDLGDLAEARVKVTDAQGLTLAQIQADTEHMRVRVVAFVKEGKLVPSRAGQPVLDSAPRLDHVRAHVDLHFQAVGIHIYVDDLKLELSLFERGDGAILRAHVRRTPNVRVRGAAFGFVPAGMLDWFIPGDIPGLARRMLDVATQGNDGEGIAASLRFASAVDGRSSVESSGGCEILDTALIRFGMKIAADRVMPDDEAEQDIRRLRVAYRDAFAADVERFANYGKLP